MSTVSVEVELERLLPLAQGFGTVPMLLTTDPDRRPRATATSLVWDGTVVTARAGRRSLANATDGAPVSLLWPAPPGERFALLVDGSVIDATADPEGTLDASGRPSRGGVVRVRVEAAILHVVAERPPR